MAAGPSGSFAVGGGFFGVRSVGGGCFGAFPAGGGGSILERGLAGGDAGPYPGGRNITAGGPLGLAFGCDLGTECVGGGPGAANGPFDGVVHAGAGGWEIFGGGLCNKGT